MSKKQNPNLKFDGTERLTYSGGEFRGFPEDDEKKESLGRGETGDRALRQKKEEEVAACEPSSYTIHHEENRHREHVDPPGRSSISYQGAKGDRFPEPGYDPTIPWENTDEAMTFNHRTMMRKERSYINRQYMKDLKGMEKILNKAGKFPTAYGLGD